MKNLAAKLLEVQKEVGAIKKDATNPFFKSKYADINSFIDTVKPILNKHGVVLLQPLTKVSYAQTPGLVGSNNKGEAVTFIESSDKYTVLPALKTILIDAETGEKIEELIPLPSNTDPQKMGSIITYYRRYALQSILFLQAEDDDGNGASGKKDEITKDDNDLDL